MRFRKSSADAATSSPLKLLSPNNKNNKNDSDGRRKSMFQSPTSILKKRPKTSTPAAAAASVQPPLVEYPVETEVPSKALVQALYEDAIQDENNHQVQLDEWNSGLLSLEQVLLPAVARSHAQALKQLQAKLQRNPNDNKDKIKAIEACRIAIYQAVAAGIQQAQETRDERETIMLKELEEEKQLEKQEAAERRLEKKEKLKQQRLLKAKQLYEPNRAAKQEGLNLMAELAVLEKEERLWKEAQKQLQVRKQELEKKKAEKQVEHETDDISTTTTISLPQAQELEEAIQNITTSSVRICQAVESVSNLVHEADEIRKEIYGSYKQDFQFRGYRGANDTKGLFRALTQDSDSDNDME